MLAMPPIRQLDGKYRLLAQLGQGGTANVSLAALRGPSGFNKLVVLKSMKEALKAEPEFARMFMTEARLAARLNHPNIVQTNEVFEIDGLPVIVMEYLEGQPLSNILARDPKRSKFTLAMHLRVLSDTLSGLQYSHELKDYDGTALEVVHRDVSPHNVFVTFNGQVKLLDFGIAKLSGSQGDTATGVIKGKLRYMPPEQVAAEGVDRRSDLYSVGVMLWEAATGMKMWHGMSDATVMNRILTGNVARARELGVAVEPALERIIDRAMAPEREDRYDSAQEMAADLDAYGESLSEQPHHRDIGAAIEQLFADERRTTRLVVDEQLSKVASLTQAEYEKVQPPELTTFASVSGAFAKRGAGGDGGRSRAGRARVATTGLVVAALFCTGMIFGWKLFAAPESAPSGPRPNHYVPPESAVTKQVALRVTAFPATARLYLDGELLPSNPVTHGFERDSARTVVLEAKADGHQTERRLVKLDQDWDIVLTLTPIAPAPPKDTKAVVAKKRKLPEAKPESPRASAVPDTACNPPYFFDERGVKKYKANCLGAAQ